MLFKIIHVCNSCFQFDLYYIVQIKHLNIVSCFFFFNIRNFCTAHTYAENQIHGKYATIQKSAFLIMIMFLNEQMYAFIFLLKNNSFFFFYFVTSSVLMQTFDASVRICKCCENQSRHLNIVGSNVSLFLYISRIKLTFMNT